jgi:hypothetical protein
MSGPTSKLGVVLLALAVAGCLVACKEGNPIDEVISPVSAEFTEHDIPAGVSDHHVSLRKSAVNGGRVTLDVVITEIDQPVIGIAIKLTYPDAFSRFVKCDDGDLFPAGNCHFAEPGPGLGEVFVARSITSPDQATTVTGSQVVARLEFLVFGVDAGAIQFEGQNLGGGDASAVLDVNGDPIFVQWFAGVIEGL